VQNYKYVLSCVPQINLTYYYLIITDTPIGIGIGIGIGISIGISIGIGTGIGSGAIKP
jgi:hypothetical protein